VALKLENEFVVAASMLGDFSKRLSEVMANGDAGTPAATPAAAGPDQDSSAGATAPPQPEALKVGGLLGKVVLARIKSLFTRPGGRR
jgi:hypothetical protein